MARAKTPGNGNTRRKQVATMHCRLFELKKNPSTADLEAEIRRRAYELYEQRGYTPGHENEDWLVAEQEVLSRATTTSRALSFTKNTWGQPPRLSSGAKLDVCCLKTVAELRSAGQPGAAVPT